MVQDQNISLTIYPYPFAAVFDRILKITTVHLWPFFIINTIYKHKCAHTQKTVLDVWECNPAS